MATAAPLAPPPDTVVPDTPDAQPVPGVATVAASPTQTPPLAPPPDTVIPDEDVPARTQTAPSSVLAPPPDTVVPDAGNEYTPDSKQAGGLVTRGGSALLSDDDVSRIAASSGADPDWVRSAAPWYGLAAPRRPAKEGAPTTAETLSGLGQFAAATAGKWVPDLGVDLYKKLAVGDENKRKALDALEDEAHSRRSYLEAAEAQVPALVATEGVSGAVGSVLGKVGGAAADVLPLSELGVSGIQEYSAAASAASSRVIQIAVKMAAIGAGQGAIEAHEGHETGGAVVGAFTALGLHAAATGLAAGAEAGARRLQKSATEALEEFVAPKATMDRAADAFEAAGEGEDALSTVIRTFNPDTKPDIGYFAREVPRPLQERIASLSGEAVADAAMSDIEREAVGDAVGKYDSVTRAAYTHYSETRSLLGKVLGVQGDDWSGAFTRAAADPQAADGYVADRVAAVRLGKYVRSEIGDSPELRQLGDVSLVRRWFLKLADARAVYDAIDTRFGTELAPLMTRGSQLHGAYTSAARVAATDSLGVVRALVKAEPKTRTGESFRDVFVDAGREGEFSAERFTDKQLVALKAQRDFYANGADRIESLPEQFPNFGLTPVSIERRLVGSDQSYIPNYAVDWADAVERTRSRLEAAAGSDSVGEWRVEAERLFGLREGEHSTPESEDLLHGLEYHYGGELKTPEDVRAAVDVVAGFSPRSGAGVRSSAASLFEREGNIPDYLLEKDPLRLMQGWSTSMYRHVFLRGFLSDMLQGAESVSDVAPVYAQYIRGHVTDLVGPRSGTLATWISNGVDRLRIAASRAAANTENPAKRWGYNVVANADDWMRAGAGNMYSFYLGLNPASATRYAYQTVSHTMPHLDLTEYAGDATRRVAAAYAETGAKLFARDATNAFTEMSERGFLPSSQMFEASAAARATMSSSMIGRANANAVAAANALSMKLIQSADVIGRYSTWTLARGIAQDAAAGDAAALSHISRVPAGFLSEIRRSLRAGDAEAAGDSYARYLISQTQGNYDRIAMSQWGRSAGYIFSMFTKWPTIAIGELGGLADARMAGRPMNGDVGRLMWKYMGPVVWTSILQSWWKEHYDEMPAAARVAIGRDVTKLYPSEAIAKAAGGELMRLPIPVEATLAAGKALFSGNPAAAFGVAAGLAVSAAPFSGYLHFATNTLPGWMGEEPLIPLTPREISAAIKD